MPWTKIGGPAHSLAFYGTWLAALTPDQQAVYLRDPGTGSWEQIGGPAGRLIGSGWDLYATAPDGGAVWRYDGNTWSKIGGPGAQFVGICNALYALTPDRKRVFRYDRYTNTWTQIGGPAQSIIGGGSKVYAAAPGNGAIWEWSRYSGSWTKIGGAGARWVGVGGTVYGLTPNKQAVYRYNGKPGSWSKVGGPADRLIGGGWRLLATEPGNGNLWRYRGTGSQWDKVGTPGTGFVAVGRTIVGMTTDKSEVFQYDDDSTESARLRKLIHGVYDPPDFGNRVVRGFLVKEVGGEILAEHCSEECFQPLSTLKLLPYFHALRQVDQGIDSLTGTTVSWVQPTSGTLADMVDKTCIDQGTSGTQVQSSALADALPTMMWESHNRTLDSVLDRYGPANITTQAQALGLTQTEMYFGCPQPNGPQAPWADNISTLLDLAHLFEGVEGLTFVSKSSTRTAFHDNMITLDAAPGTSYSSPITGRTTGPLSNEFLRPIVEREAGVAKLAQVPAFMQHIVVRGKGGSGGPRGDEIGGSDFLEVALPFKSRSSIRTRKFIVAWYIGQFRGVPDTVKQPEDAELGTFRNEIHTEPIRRALATW